MEQKHIIITAIVLLVLWQLERSAQANNIVQAKATTPDPFNFTFSTPSGNYGFGLPAPTPYA